MVGISFACKPTRQPEMDLTIEMPPTFPSKKVSKKPCNFEQVEEMVEMEIDELDLRPFRNSFHSTCLARPRDQLQNGVVRPVISGSMVKPPFFSLGEGDRIPRGNGKSTQHFGKC